MNRETKGEKSQEGLAYYWPSILLTLSILVAWEIAIRVRWINPIYLASPTGAAEAFWELVRTGEIWKHAGISFFRFGSGLALGAVSGIGVGILTGGYTPIRRSFEPLINALYGAPKIALLPLFILLMGIGELTKVVIIASSTFFSFWINTHAGMQNIDDLLVRVARNFGASEMQVLRKVKVRAILPYIFVGFRLSVGQALVLVIAAEFLAAKSGLGYLIDAARESFQLERLISLIFLFGGLSFALNRSILFVEEKLSPWKERRSR